MMSLATAVVDSPAAPAAFFARWADAATWPEWNTDTDWVRLDGDFVEGVTGTLKPKSGPRVRFVVARLVPDERFTDVSSLIGARLTFDHRVTVVGSSTRVEVDVTLDGPLAFLWRRILGGGIRAALQPDLDRLASVVLQAHAA